MKFWLPYTTGNSGSDVSIEQLAKALQSLGHEAIAEAFPHQYQYIPWALKTKNPPTNTDCIIGNSWNAFAFKRENIPLITIERLFVLDKAYTPYKSFQQSLFHNILLKHWLEQSYKTSDAIIALSHNTAKGICSIFEWATPTVIMNAVDTDFFCPPVKTKEYSINRPLKILYVGNLSKRKGTDLLPQILNKLGDNVHLSYTEDRNQIKGIPHPNATSIGRLDLNGVKKAYHEADILILPTRLEGLPRAAMESIACGTPVISSKASSLPELVKNNVNGYTCDTDNIDSFVETISRISSNKGVLKELSLTSRQYALDHLNLKYMAKKYIDLAIELKR